uniref:Uncharacterized protein n=1 Tax=Populus trichocarpa TaxID=3694 RepID=A0A2K2A9S6_POPTR
MTDLKHRHTNTRRGHKLQHKHTRPSINIGEQTETSLLKLPRLKRVQTPKSRASNQTATRLTS